MEAAQLGVGLRAAEAGDQDPLVSGLVAEPRRVNGAPSSVGYDLRQEAVRPSGLPRVDEVALPAGTLVAELADVDFRAASEEATMRSLLGCRAGCRCLNGLQIENRTRRSRAGSLHSVT